MDKVDWIMLSYNENAIHILEQNLDKIRWASLSYNKNAGHILEKNLDKVNWNILAMNQNAIHMLCKLDYKKMLDNNKDFCEELVGKVRFFKTIKEISDLHGSDIMNYLNIHGSDIMNYFNNLENL